MQSTIQEMTNQLWTHVEVNLYGQWLQRFDTEAQKLIEADLLLEKMRYPFEQTAVLLDSTLTHMQAAWL